MKHSHLLALLILTAALAFGAAAFCAVSQPAGGPDGALDVQTFQERMRGDDQEDRLQAVREALASPDVLLRALALETALASRRAPLRELGLDSLLATRGKLAVEVQDANPAEDFLAEHLLHAPPLPAPLASAVQRGVLHLTLAPADAQGRFIGESDLPGRISGSVIDGTLRLVIATSNTDACTLTFDTFEAGALVGSMRCGVHARPCRLPLP